MTLMTCSAWERIVRYSSCLLALLCVSSPRLLAQQVAPPPDQAAKPASELETQKVDLTLQDQSIAAILEALSDQIGRSIVMDGKPQVSRGSFKLQTTAKSALDQVAEFLDCSWTVSKHGAILMSKRFLKLGDLPQMHLKEMQKMAADLLTIWPENASKVRLSNYPFVTVRISPGNALYRALLEEQRHDLEHGRRFTFLDFNPEQQDLLRLCLVSYNVGTSHDVWEGLNARLADISHSYLQWRPWSYNGVDFHPTRLQYSLDYIWPDPKEKGYERLVSASEINDILGEKGK